MQWVMPLMNHWHFRSEVDIENLDRIILGGSIFFTSYDKKAKIEDRGIPKSYTKIFITKWGVFKPIPPFRKLMLAAFGKMHHFIALL